jgi:ABC-type multidrug transport system fused ATPase/permease subunit
MCAECTDCQSVARTDKSHPLLLPNSSEVSSSLCSTVSLSDQHTCAASESSLPYPTRNKSLPDIDDLSATYVFAYTEHYKTNLFWSLLSDSFFIVGSMIYIYISMWNFLSQGSVETKGPLQNKVYIILDVLAPLVYLLNCIVDIQCATRVQQRQMDKRKLTQYWEEIATNYTAIQQESTFSEEDNPESSFLCCGITCRVTAWCYRLRKHAAHRRTVWAAFMFGIAVSLAASAAVVRALLDYHPLLKVGSIGTKLDIASDYIYLVSAIVSLTGKRNRPWMAPGPVALGTSMWKDPERSEDLGDALFFIGCVLDVVLDDARLADAYCLAALSSFLWFLDGCLYMHSDVVKAAHLQKTQTSGTNVSIV